MTYQVVCMDANSFINEFKDFTNIQIGPMLAYINKKCLEPTTNKIQIIRFNSKGERE